MDHAHYFKRNTVYKVEGDTIAVVDVHDNNTITPLEPWMGIVLSLADGQHTLGQLIQHMAGQYPNGAPDNLADTIESVIQRLVDAGVIEITPQASTLPYYLSKPIDEQDPKLATELMVNDGFLRPPEK